MIWASVHPMTNLLAAAAIVLLSLSLAGGCAPLPVRTLHTHTPTVYVDASFTQAEQAALHDALSDWEAASRTLVFTAVNLSHAETEARTHSGMNPDTDIIVIRTYGPNDPECPIGRIQPDWLAITYGTVICVDAQHLAAEPKPFRTFGHEIGHALGLQHTFGKKSIMRMMVPDCADSPTPEDMVVLHGLGL